jgi:hypothetical protein
MPRHTTPSNLLVFPMNCDFNEPYLRQKVEEDEFLQDAVVKYVQGGVEALVA